MGDRPMVSDEEARNRMATLVAEITSGIDGAIPEQDDFDIADDLIREVNRRLL